MAPVTTGESHPLRLPKVVIIPEIDPEHYAEMSLRVVQRAADAAKLNPAASASCNRARFSRLYDFRKTTARRSRLCPSQAATRRPCRFPIVLARRSETQPHSLWPS